MSAPEKLPPGKQVAYAIGQFGWSTLVNTVNITLVYFISRPRNRVFPLS